MKWTKDELRILEHKAADPVADWMEANYLLDGPAVAEPGPYRFSRSPYFKSIADKFENTREIVIRKSAQCGYSVFFTGLMSYIIANSPSDMLLVFPTADAGADFLQEKVYVSFRKQRWMKRLLPQSDKDFTKSGISLANCSIHLGHSGSPTSLASRSIRYIFADEISKFQSNLKEADPISLMSERQITYGNRARTIYGCTPTHDQDEICKLFDSAGEQYYYHLPCPDCGKLYNPDIKLVKWTIPKEHKESPATRQRYIEEHDCVRLECPNCKFHITEAMRLRSLNHGQWIAKGQWQNSEGEIVGEENKKARRKAFQINRLMTVWGTLEAHAIEFVDCMNDPHKFRNFSNSWQGLPYKHTDKEHTSTEVKQLCLQTIGRREVPDFGGYLIASADTQDTSFHWSVWKISDQHAHLIDYGQVQDQQALKEAVFKDFGGQTPQILAIDARGHRQSDVYHFASTDNRIVCVMGGNTRFDPPFKKTTTAEYATKSYTIDTIYFKDKLFDWIETGKVTTFRNIDQYWYDSIAAEQKETYFEGGKTKTRYRELVKNKNHQLDCFNYALFSYDLLVATTGKTQYERPKDKVRIQQIPLLPSGNNRRF